MITVIAERVRHDSGMRVALKFPFDQELTDLVRKLPDVRWSQRMQCWHIADSDDVIPLLLRTLSKYVFVDYTALRRQDIAGRVRLIRSERQNICPKPKSAEIAPAEDARWSEPVRTEPGESPGLLSSRGKEDILRYRLWLESHRYPPTTVRTYTSMMEAFLKFVSPREASESSADDLIRMVNEYILPRGLSYSFQNQLISSVKKFYREICRKTIDPGEFTRPRSLHKLPNVLSKEEVKKILSAPLNEKHRVMLSLIYGCGLRRSEAIMLEPQDIDRDRMLLSIRQSKGFKDRIVPVSVKLVEMVDTYVRRYRPVVYLFEGQRQGTGTVLPVLRRYSGWQWKKQGLRRILRFMVCVTVMQRIYWRQVRIFVTFRSYWGIRAAGPLRYTLMSPKKVFRRIRTPFDDL